MGHVRVHVAGQVGVGQIRRLSYGDSCRMGHGPWEWEDSRAPCHDACIDNGLAPAR